MDIPYLKHDTGLNYGLWNQPLKLNS